MDKYNEDLQAFLNSSLRNTWIKYPNFEVYVRKGYHLLEGKQAITFDVANIHVHEEARGKGIFSTWLDMVETMAHEEGFDAVYVENLLNPLLANFLVRAGYTRTGPMDLSSYYLKV